MDDVEDEFDDTPLHMAAQAGHVTVMKKLIAHDADPNAFSNFSGLVITAAISSGKIGAVELLVDHGVSLTPERDSVEAPLAQAAAVSDITMFEYLLEKYASRLPPEEYSKALTRAAGAGRVDIFNRLLQFNHNPQEYQWALDRATDESRWDIIHILLNARAGLGCDEAFLKAATSPDDRDDVLERLWEYSGGSISRHIVNDSLYHATDREKFSTVKALLHKYGADPNATGSE